MLASDTVNTSFVGCGTTGDTLGISGALQALVFILFSAYWWAKACWKVVKERRKPRCHPVLLDHVAVKVYLCFLKTCRNLFWTLTVVALLFITPNWGIRPFKLFICPLKLLPLKDSWNVGALTECLVALTDDPGDVTHGLNERLACICCMAGTLSILTFFFVIHFQHHVEKIRTASEAAVVNEQHVSRLSRALWLEDLPMQDHATCLKHELTLADFANICQKDLREAIDNQLNSDSSVHGGSHTGSTARCLGSCGCCGCRLACAWLCLCCRSQSVRRKQQDKAARIASPKQGPSEWMNTIINKPQRRHVEEITVLPVMSVYCSFVDEYIKIKDAEGRMRVWAEKKDAFKPKTESIKWNRPSSWLEHLSHRLRVRMHSRWKSKANQLRTNFIKEAEHPEVANYLLEMSGHAFVVFSQASDVDKMTHPARQWWELRDGTPFRFGRPPFSSVTLTCRHAPHPADLIWKHMHIPLCPHFFFHIVNTSLLLICTIIVVAAIVCAWELNTALEVWRKFFPDDTMHLDHHLKKILPSKHPMLVGGGLEQVATMALLAFNSLVVPQWVKAISRCRRYYRHRSAKLLHLNLNLAILILSSCVCPVVAFFTMQWLRIHSSTEARGPLTYTHVVGKSGIFALQYSINCTFISNLEILLQVGRRISRKVKLWFCVVTESDMKSAMARVQVPWGYWYAWSFSIACTSLIFSIVVPSILPITAIGFTLKLAIERHLFAEGLLDPGPARAGGYAIRMVVSFEVVMYVRLVLLLVLLISPLCVFHTSSMLPYISLIIFGFSWLTVILQVCWCLNHARLGTYWDQFWRKSASLLPSWTVFQSLWSPFKSLRQALVESPAVDESRDREEDAMTWDARINILKELELENEPDEELRSALCKLLCVAWDETRSRPVQEAISRDLEDVTLHENFLGSNFSL